MPPRNIARQFQPENRAIAIQRGLPPELQQMERGGLSRNVASVAAGGETLAKGIGREAIHNPFNFILDLIPGIGDVKAGQEAISGRNIVTGERLGGLERILSGVATLPFIPGTIKKLGKGKTLGKNIVKNETGKPLTVFHGSQEIGIKGLDPSFAVETPGVVFFSDNSDVSEIFRFERDFGEVVTDFFDESLDDFVDIEPGDLVEAHIELKNPLILSGDEAQKATFDTGFQGEVIRKAKAKGHDGVIFRDVEEGVGDALETGTTYGVFSKDQIKIKRIHSERD